MYSTTLKDRYPEDQAWLKSLSEDYPFEFDIIEKHKIKIKKDMFNFVYSHIIQPVQLHHQTNDSTSYEVVVYDGYRNVLFKMKEYGNCDRVFKIKPDKVLEDLKKFLHKKKVIEMYSLENESMGYRSGYFADVEIWIE